MYNYKRLVKVVAAKVLMLPVQCSFCVCTHVCASCRARVFTVSV